MTKKINCILLVDNDHDDNFFSEWIIKKGDFANIIIAKESGKEALAYLRQEKADKIHLDLIFLDINMPGMDGWEFLKEYDKLDKKRQRSIVIILTTSNDPNEKARAKTIKTISEFRTKPMTKEMVSEIIETHFSPKRQTNS